MIKKSQLKKQLETNRLLILDLQRSLDGLRRSVYANEIANKYSIYEARLCTLEDAIGQLIELKYPENMNEQQKIFFRDTLKRLGNKVDKQ